MLEGRDLVQVMILFFCKRSDSRYFRHVGHMVSFTNIQLCDSIKAVIDNTYIKQMHGDMLSTKLYLKKKKQGMG